jgi:hypothetical protein
MFLDQEAHSQLELPHLTDWNDQCTTTLTMQKLSKRWVGGFRSPTTTSVSIIMKGDPVF